MPSFSKSDRPRPFAAMEKTRLALCVGAALSGLACNATAGTIILELEEPSANAVYSGITNLRGYAVSDAGIAKVELYIDGTYVTDVPSGASRPDVAAVYPNYPSSDKSGFSMAYNYNKLSAAQHTVLVRAQDRDGDVSEKSATFSVQKFHSSYFADPNVVNVDNASFSVGGNGFQVAGMRVDGQDYDVNLNWSTAAQGFRFSSVQTASNNGGGGTSGDCVTVPFVSNGTRAVWDVTGGEGSGTVDTTYVSVTTNKTTTQTHSALSAQGVSTTSDTQTVQTYSIADNHLYVSKIDVSGNGSAMCYSYAISSSITHEPAKLIGPAEQFCAGQTWTAPSVKQTIVANGQTIVNQTAVENGSVESINASVSTAAGSFTTVKVKVEVDGGDDIETWTDIRSGVMVKQETRNSSGALTANSVLTSLN